MDLQVERWFEAVAARTSRRAFEPRLPDEILSVRLDKTCREFRPFSEARVELVRRPADGVFKGIIGSYGRVTGAPAYLAVIGDMGSPRAQECAGYTGEGVILEATALGFGTCWVGGFFGRDAAAAQAGLREGENLLAISPVGIARTSLTFTDRTFKLFAGSKRRKPLEELVESGTLPGGPVRKALEAARLAPSAYNRQPWRFRFEDGAAVIRADKADEPGKISRRLDCGIAMLHFELGARAASLAGSWEFLPPPDVARFTFRPA